MVPRTSENFRALCTGSTLYLTTCTRRQRTRVKWRCGGSDPSSLHALWAGEKGYGYKGCPFHRIIPGTSSVTVSLIRMHLNSSSYRFLSYAAAYPFCFRVHGSRHLPLTPPLSTAPFHFSFPPFLFGVLFSTRFVRRRLHTAERSGRQEHFWRESKSKPSFCCIHLSSAPSHLLCVTCLIVWWWWFAV